MYYFAYGSNMDSEDLKSWCERKKKPIIIFKKIIFAKLNNYKLLFNYNSKIRQGGVANILKSENNVVYGFLVKLKEEDIISIQQKEGFIEENHKRNVYDKINIQVETFDNKIIKNIETFQINTKESIHYPPTTYYFNLIYKNAKKFKFPQKYIKYLESFKIKK